MTHQILQSDIDLANKLLVAGVSDLEIVVALTRRRIEHDSATQLVADLRRGEPVKSQMELSPAGTLLFLEKREGEPIGELRPTSRSTQSRTIKRRRRRSGSGGRGNSNRVGILMGILLMLGVFGGGIAVWYKKYHARNSSLLEHLESVVAAPVANPPAAEEASISNRTGSGESRADPGVETLSDYQSLTNQLVRRRLTPSEATRLTAAVSQEQRRTDATTKRDAAGSTPGLQVEIRPDGVHIGGTLVARHQALQTLCRALGAPARTNHLDQSTTVVYAYDSQGLLLYSQPAAATDSIVLDFDASGGGTGATSPFSGILKIENEVIHAETDSETLAATRQLQLNRPAPEAAIFKGLYDGVELNFAYLKTPHRLSLIQIDLE